MLRLALTFLVVALVAALFGFGQIQTPASSIARLAFPIFLALFLLSLIRATLRHH